MGHATDIVYYQYRADNWCGKCVCEQVVDDYNLPENPQHATSYEQELEDYAVFLNIDYEDEHSYDTDHFPKVVFRSQVEETESCAGCRQELD